MTQTQNSLSGRSPDDLIADLLTGGLEEPFDHYAELRETGDGVHWCAPLNGWLVLRHDDVRDVAANHENYSSEYFFDSQPSVHDPSDPEQRRFVDINSLVLMFKDPPRHTMLRSIFRTTFTPSSVRSWTQRISEVADETIDRLSPGEEVDFMTHLAADVPVAIIASILGIPREGWSTFRDGSFAYASTFDPLVQGELRSRMIATALRLLDYMGDVIEQRRREPRDDLATRLVQAGTDQALSQAEVLAQLGLLLVAGNETTTNLLGNGMSLLLDHPAAKRALQRDPSMIPEAIEEMLRFDPPLHLTGRKTTRSCTLAGHDLPAGTLVYPVIAAANRDPRRFDAPDVFDIERVDKRHLSFLHGIHFCVGAPLARSEGHIVLARVLERFPDIAPGSAPPVRRTTNAIARGWAKLPVLL